MRKHLLRPVQNRIIKLLEASPLPWTPVMVAAELGITQYSACTVVVQCATKNRIWRCAFGMYTAICRRPLHLGNTVTYSPCGPSDVITDDMLARFGYNL